MSIPLAEEIRKYEMPMFKCVTMAKCGNLILIDDQGNKVSILSNDDLSIIFEKSTAENDNSHFLFSAI